MSYSLKYEAKRDCPLTEDEIEDCNRFIKLFCDNFPFKDEAEEFQVSPGNDEKTVFYGSTEIPDISEKAFAGCIQHWTSLLYEIRTSIKDSEWSVTLDGFELIWSDEEGWQFPKK